MYKKQTTFNRVVRHLRKQGKKALKPMTNQCRYRALGGLKCAIGCLIPDAQYKRSLEGKLIQRIVNKVPALKRHDLTLMNELQYVHDWCREETWERWFQFIAKKHKLMVPALKKG